jgi:hypothetical protein
MHELAELRDRLRHIEGRQRRLHAWCAASSVLWIVACAAAVAAPETEELRIRRLVLLDERGAELGVLDSDEKGAWLALKSHDGDAGVSLAATTATWTRSSAPAGFVIGPDGSVADAASTEVEEQGPWSGLMAWTGTEQPSCVTTVVSAGSIGGLTVADGDCRIAMRIEGPAKRPMLELARAHSTVTLAADERGAGLAAEAGDETWSVVNLFATDRGAGVDGSFQDERDFELFATNEKAALHLLRGCDLAGSAEPRPEVDLQFDGDAGSLVLHRSDAPIFRAPE